MAIRPLVGLLVGLAWLVNFITFSFSGLLLWSYLSFGQVSSNVLLFYVRQGDAGASQLEPSQIALLFGLVFAGLGLALTGFLIARRLSLGNFDSHTFGASTLITFSVSAAVLAFMLSVSTDFRSASEASPSSLPADGAPNPEIVVDPTRSELNGVNVIHIFFESLATDIKGVGGREIADELSSVFSWSSVALVEQESEHTHTIAGMVASLCGNKFDTLNFLDNNHPSYLHSNSECVSDFTSASGYRNVYLGGADLSFQNKGDFLEEHRFETLGKSDWEFLAEPQMTSWGQGLHDSRLFRRAKSQVRSLVSSAQPYYLTILTLDTHYPYYKDPLCPIAGNPNDSTASYTCTLNALTDFIYWLESYGVLENTVVIVQGDHLPIESSIHLEGSQIPIYLRVPQSTQPSSFELESIFDIKGQLLELMSAK